MAEKKPTGRPSTYSDKVASEICRRMAAGESVRQICRDKKMPAASTVFLWVAEDREGFSERYAKAFESRMYYHADELLDIADDGSNDYIEREDPKNPGYMLNGEAVARSRLRVDTRKWLMSKLLHRYSDKPQEDDGKSSLEDALSKLIDRLPE